MYLKIKIESSLPSNWKYEYVPVVDNIAFVSLKSMLISGIVYWNQQLLVTNLIAMLLNTLISPYNNLTDATIQCVHLIWSTLNISQTNGNIEIRKNMLIYTSRGMLKSGISI